ncbi:transmembrane channel-like protein 6 isoform X2 [Salminus brasiliensis]|uniref:transmembrane channel-like protein 6 isoform X2 n=1 Tax=Salminus brasiliensis TaxID=930266 RepID=UPI003B834BF9
MACSVNSSLDVCQTERDSECTQNSPSFFRCSMENDHDTSSCTDGDFETVEMDLMGENSTHKVVDETAEKNTLTRKRWSAATQRVLSSMPSRSIEWTSEAVLSQRAQASLKDHFQASRTSNRDNESHGSVTYEVPQRKHQLATLQALSAAECARMLRSLPLSLKKKRELRAQACHEKGCQAISAKATNSSHFQSRLGKSLHGARQGVQSLLNSVQLWHEALKQVSGRFGTGVLSYFLFIRTLLLYNVFLSLVTIPFLVLPQVIRSSYGSTNNVFTISTNNFTGLEILTGTGVLTNSLMFYGYYNYTDACRPFNKTCIEGKYNIRLAYFLIIGIGLFVTCIMLVYSVFKTLGRTFHISKSRGNLALKVFSSWDFKVSKAMSVQLLSENLCTQLKEMLCELHSGNPRRSVITRLIWFALHCTAWGICLTCIFCCVLAIYIFSHNREHIKMKWTSAVETHLLILPLLVCGLNYLLPSVFNMVAWMESYDSISLRIYVAIIRNLFLKVSTLGVLCYHWLDRIATEKLQCWETFVGQELYRFLLMDLLFGALYTVFGDFLWRLGVLFSPLLPAIQIGKLLLLFYMKRASLMINCQAPRTPWRATQMTTLFVSLLCFPSFLGAAACITYTMWRLEPSSTCGPFRTLSSMFLAGKEWRKSLETSNLGLTWLSWVYTLLENPIFLFIIAGIFLLVIYIHVQVGDGQRRIMALLQKQIENEGEDKKFLISKLQTLHEQQKL